jgi:hypothetical protein
MKKVVFQCPVCGKQRLQALPESIIDARNYIRKEIIAILIPENTLCEHAFLVYIDTNFSIRDVVTLDLMVEVNKQKIISLQTIEEIIKKMSPDSLRSVLKNL